MASHTPFALATANVSHGVRNASTATMAAVNIAIGPASGARQRNGTRKTSSATMGDIASTQCRRSTGTRVSMRSSADNTVVDPPTWPAHTENVDDVTYNFIGCHQLRTIMRSVVW